MTCDMFRVTAMMARCLSDVSSAEVLSDALEAAVSSSGHPVEDRVWHCADGQSRGTVYNATTTIKIKAQDDLRCVTVDVCAKTESIARAAINVISNALRPTTQQVIP